MARLIKRVAVAGLSVVLLGLGITATPAAASPIAGYGDAGVQSQATTDGGLVIIDRKITKNTNIRNSGGQTAVTGDVRYVGCYDPGRGRFSLKVVNNKPAMILFTIEHWDATHLIGAFIEAVPANSTWTGQALAHNGYNRVELEVGHETDPGPMLDWDEAVVNC